MKRSLKNLGPAGAPPHLGVMGSVIGFDVQFPAGVTVVNTILGCTHPMDRFTAV